MRVIIRAVLTASVAAILAGSSIAPASAFTRLTEGQSHLRTDMTSTSNPAGTPAFAAASKLRIATFNTSLNREYAGALASDLSTPQNAQGRAVAEIVQRSAPDILLVNEFDYDAKGESAGYFRTNYLAVGQNGQDGIDYPYVYAAPSNTGVPSGADLDRDGTVGGPADALGYGDFEGQYGMVLYSRYPILTGQVRTLQNFLWADMPDSRLPTDFYSPLKRKVLRLPSKSQWDVPVQVGDAVIHVIAAHPTPPVFDGPEKRNQRRNHDEIRLINDYVTGGKAAKYIYDDAGKRGGLAKGEKFVVLGDLNSDPARGDSDPVAITSLLGNKLLRDVKPASPSVTGDPIPGQPVTENVNTADFGRGALGMLRVDYVLPSRNLLPEAAGVFWPGPGSPGNLLVSGWPSASSDHRLVWVDVKAP
ncbi:endonuclease/exonuclease/phosphatase family protein [Paeniglutamicibacter cryotolerans]|uniref:Endonuclease/exonuclease/phosphatase domain-containing protein n=1 Tax=Paeniglutamicibacter cryotolerans TaxID=670079 RepID=A0A839QJY2_9MICC|nr:endonuclease/exonuclease/phosphatase family protein [Paeniglutamicibacter cryotolerans]MBB2995054.1 hypothetical protein [Paeniglutamicibacter cryotolerans]